MPDNSGLDYLTNFMLPLYAATVLSVILTTIGKFRGIERGTFLLIAFLWALCVLLRPWGITPDDSNYETHIDMVCSFKQCGWDHGMEYSWLYYATVGLLKDFDNTHQIFLVIAATFFALKMLLLGRMTRYSMPGLMVYVSIFLMLHDMVQLRVAVATFFYLLVLKWFAERKYVRSIFPYVAGYFVHAQSAVMPLAFVTRFVFRDYYRAAIAVALALLAAVQMKLVPTSALITMMSVEGGGYRALASLLADPAPVGLTSFAILGLLALSIPTLRRMEPKRLRLFEFAFYSVIAGFFLYWVGAAFETVSSRLAQFMWLPVVLLASQSRRSPVFFWGTITISVAFFILQGWVIRLLGAS